MAVFFRLKKAYKMGVTSTNEVKFTTFAGRKISRAQTHRWRSGK